MNLSQRQDGLHVDQLVLIVYLISFDIMNIIHRTEIWKDGVMETMSHSDGHRFVNREKSLAGQGQVPS